MEWLIFGLKAYLVIGICIAAVMLITANSKNYQEYFESEHPDQPSWNFMDTLITATIGLLFWPYILWTVHKEINNDK